MNGFHIGVENIDNVLALKHGNAFFCSAIAYGEMHLYFGCRNSTMDNIHKDERDVMYRKGVLTSNKTALSREPELPKVRVHL